MIMKALPKGEPAKKPAEKPFKSEDHKDHLRADLADLMAEKKPAPKPAAKPKDKPAEPAPPAKPDLAQPQFVDLLALLKEYKAGGQFGPGSVAEGDSIAFKAGEYSGSGQVLAAGAHGVTVQDKTAREHRIHWHEVTGHEPGKGGKKKAKDAA